MPQIAANPTPVVNVQVPVPVPTPVPPARRQPRPAAPPPPPTGSRPRRPTPWDGGAVYILPHTPEPLRRLGRKRRYSAADDVAATHAAVSTAPKNQLNHQLLADSLEDAGHSAAAEIVRLAHSQAGNGWFRKSTSGLYGGKPGDHWLRFFPGDPHEASYSRRGDGDLLVWQADLRDVPHLEDLAQRASEEGLNNDGRIAISRLHGLDQSERRPDGRYSRRQLLHRLARSLGEQNVQPANTGGGRRRYSREDHEAFQSGILSKYDGRAGWRAKDEAAGHTDPLLPLAYADWLDDHDHPAGKVIRWAMQPERRQLLRQMGQRGMFTGWAADPPDEGGISYSTGVGARVRQHPTHPIILSADFQHGEGDGKRYGRFFAPVTPDEAREVADQIEARLPGHKTAADMRALADRFDRRPRQNARRRYSAPFDRHAAASALAAAGKPAHAAMLRSAARIGPPAADGHAVSVGRVSSTGDALVRLHLPAGSHGPAATVERTVRPLQAAILRLALRREGAADDAWGDHSTLPPARGVA